MDIRHAPQITLLVIQNLLGEWCVKSGPNVTYKILDRVCPAQRITIIDPKKTAYNADSPIAQRLWVTFCKELQNSGESYYYYLC